MLPFEGSGKEEGAKNSRETCLQDTEGFVFDPYQRAGINNTDDHCINEQVNQHLPGF